MTENTEFEATEFDPSEEETPTDETNVAAVAALAALAGAGATAAICWFRRNRAALKERIEARKAEKEKSEVVEESSKKDED